MKKFTILILLIFLLIITACSDKEMNPETKSNLEFKKMEEIIIPKLTFERFKDFISNENPVISQSKCETVLSLLEELKPVTMDLIKSSDSEEEDLLEIANSIVQKDGYNNLDDYAIALDKVTWIAGTYMKMIDLELFLQREKEVPAIKFLGENLERRFEKYPMTRADIEIIISNWPDIETALETMNDLAKSMEEYQQKKN